VAASTFFNRDLFERIKLLVDEYKIKLDGLKKNEILYEQNRRLAENFIRSAKAPAIRAGVMMAKVIW
jgi:hypothetical protein